MLGKGVFLLLLFFFSSHFPGHFLACLKSSTGFINVCDEGRLLLFLPLLSPGGLSASRRKMEAVVPFPIGALQGENVVVGEMEMEGYEVI